MSYVSLDSLEYGTLTEGSTPKYGVGTFDLTLDVPIGGFARTCVQKPHAKYAPSQVRTHATLYAQSTRGSHVFNPRQNCNFFWCIFDLI